MLQTLNILEFDIILLFFLVVVGRGVVITAEIVVDISCLPHSSGCQALLIDEVTSRAFEKFKFQGPYSELQKLNHFSSF